MADVQAIERMIYDAIASTGNMIVDRGIAGNDGMASAHGLSNDEIFSIIAANGEDSIIEYGPGLGNFMRDVELLYGFRIRGVDVFQGGFCPDRIINASFESIPQITDKSINGIFANHSLGLYALDLDDFIGHVKELDRITADDACVYLLTSVLSPLIPGYSIEANKQAIIEKIFKMPSKIYKPDRRNYFYTNLATTIEANSNLRLSSAKVTIQGTKVKIDDQFQPRTYGVSLKFVKVKES